MTRAASSRRARIKPKKSKSRRGNSSPSPHSTVANHIGVIPGYDPIATAGDCTFNSLAARLAVDFFAECLTFTAGEWRGAPFSLQPWQTAIVANLFGWKCPDGLRRYREAFIYVPRKCGKALAVDTPIPTPGGWRQMGDLDEGDLVFDENGLPTLVTHAYAVQHVRPCYRVSFSDGTSIVADADHLWTVDDRYSGRRVASTEWMAGRACIDDQRSTSAFRFSVPFAETLHAGHVVRPVDPSALNQRKVARRSLTRQIVAIEPVESVPVRCITVDSPSHLYLAGEGMIATHNSELAGGLGNLLTFADGEPAAQTYCAAADREQARLVFNAAKTMVMAEPELASRSKVYTNAIVVESTGSVLKVISAEAYSKHGINAHGIIVDELHAQPDRELVDVLMTSTGARRQPLVIYITTADFDRPSICNEKYDYAIKVRDGIIEDPAFLPVIYEAKQDDDWTDPDVWAKANPNLGISVSMEYLERECRRARETPSYENTFKRLHLNMKTQQDVRWLSMEAWDACGKLKFDESSLEGERCFAGLDLSTTTDISALVLVFPREDGQVALVPRFWIPAESAEKRERRDRVPYTTWARQGYIEMTSGNVVDYDTIRTRINELKGRFNIKEIAIDPWNATQLSVQLQGDGFEVVTFGQGFKDMTAPAKELEKLVMSDKLRHAGHPVLRWMASNVAVETDAAGNLKPSKKKSTERIDGIVATVMGLGRTLLDEGEVEAGFFVVEWV